jgi:hypothetical protein
MSTVQVTKEKEKDKPIEKGHVIGIAMNDTSVGETIQINGDASDNSFQEFLSRQMTRSSWIRNGMVEPKLKPKLERITLNGGGYIHINLDEKRETTPTEVTEYLDGLNNTMNEVRLGGMSYGVMGRTGTLSIHEPIDTPQFTVTCEWRSSGVISCGAPDFSKLKLASDKLDTILEQTHDLKKKADHQWVKLADVAPVWYSRITSYFANPEKHSAIAQELYNSHKCIMGEVFGGDARWGFNASKPCEECSYLGTQALSLFSTIMNGDVFHQAPVTLNNSEGWNEYQARFEYHWNQKHT